MGNFKKNDQAFLLETAGSSNYPQSERNLHGSGPNEDSDLSSPLTSLSDDSPERFLVGTKSPVNLEGEELSSSFTKRKKMKPSKLKNKKKREQRKKAAKNSSARRSQHFNERLSTLKQLQLKFGLEHDTKVLISNNDDKIELNSGKVAVLNSEGTELILSVNFHHLKSPQEGFKETVSGSEFILKDQIQAESTRMDLQTISRTSSFMFPILYLHATSRHPVKNNAAVNSLPPERRQGKMFAMGYRSDSVTGKHQVTDKYLGPYALNQMSTRDLEILKHDTNRASQLPFIDNFLAEIFSTLSLSAFKSNSILASSLSAPSWSFKKWCQSENGKVFGSNLVLTCGGFRNAPHKDNDETGFSLGVWGLVNSLSGKLIESEERRTLVEQSQELEVQCNALGARFHIGNVIVNLDSADVIFMAFNSNISHYTSHPDIKKNGGGLGECFTRCGMSSQISMNVAKALRKIGNLRGDLEEEEWNELKKKFGRSYDEEIQKKKEPFV